MTREEAAAYRSGTVAYRNGKTRDENPYPQARLTPWKNPQAWAWLTGWLNAKLAAHDQIERT